MNIVSPLMMSFPPCLTSNVSRILVNFRFNFCRKAAVFGVSSLSRERLQWVDYSPSALARNFSHIRLARS